MLKKLFILLVIFVVAVAFLGGVISVVLSPFSLAIAKPGKDIFKRAARKAKNIIYREATEHNPSGDIFPDQIDDKIKQEIKEKIN